MLWRMSEVDLIKERIGRLKLWLGILVVTDVGLCGWIASSWDHATARLLTLAVITAVILAIGIYFFDRVLNRHIESLRDL